MEIWLTESLSLTSVDGFLAVEVTWTLSAPWTFTAHTRKSSSCFSPWHAWPCKPGLIWPDHSFSYCVMYDTVHTSMVGRYCSRYYYHIRAILHLICFPCSPCSTFIHICCTFSREGNCLTGHAPFAQSDLQMCHGQNMFLNFKDFKTCYLLVSHNIIHMKANGQPPLTWRNIPSR